MIIYIKAVQNFIYLQKHLETKIMNQNQYD